MRVGVAYNGAVPLLLQEAPDLVDFVEVSFEALRKQPNLLSGLDQTDVVLHCASLSVGGETEPDDVTIGEVHHFVEKTRTGWLGEHLAFITGRSFGEDEEGCDPVSPTNIGFTVGPAYTERLLDAVIERLERYEARFGVTVALENSPTYFALPGSEMSQVEFFGALCSRRPSTRLLLDLTHFMITATNLQFDANEVIAAYPLENVIEFHLSGIATEGGLAWDDHATQVPDAVWRLFDRVAPGSSAAAVTLEYNWSTTFPRSIILRDLQRIRDRVVDPRQS